MTERGRGGAEGRRCRRARVKPHSSTGSRQAALALGPAGQMILKAAITKIGTEDDSRTLRRRDCVRLAGKTLFLAADGETGAHGVDLAACGEAGKRPFPPCRAAVGRGTVRRMVEGAVGRGAGLGDHADPRKAVVAAPAPPSSVPAATSPPLRDGEENGGQNAFLQVGAYGIFKMAL